MELLSHRVGWETSTRKLAAHGVEGRQAVMTAINELVEAGYLKRTQERAEQGRFGEVEYELTSPAVTVVPKPDHGEKTLISTVVGFTVAGEPVDGESATKNTISKNTINQEHEGERPPAFCSSHMPFGSGGVPCRRCADMRRAQADWDTRHKPADPDERLRQTLSLARRSDPADCAHATASEGYCVECDQRRVNNVWVPYELHQPEAIA